MLPHLKLRVTWRGCPVTKCPRQDSNLRSRFRKPMLYPLSYEGRYKVLVKGTSSFSSLRSPISMSPEGAVSGVVFDAGDRRAALGQTDRSGEP